MLWHTVGGGCPVREGVTWLCFWRYLSVFTSSWCLWCWFHSVREIYFQSSSLTTLLKFLLDREDQSILCTWVFPTVSLSACKSLCFYILAGRTLLILSAGSGITESGNNGESRKVPLQFLLLQNNFCNKWRKNGFETAPMLKLLKKYSFVNGKILEWFFRFDAAVVFKYMHTDEADRVTDTLDAAVFLLDTVKLIGPQPRLRNWCVSSCSQEASVWKIYFITFNPNVYNSLQAIPQPLDSLYIQVTGKYSSLLSSMLQSSCSPAFFPLVLREVLQWSECS